jgi:hypothetical protein
MAAKLLRSEEYGMVGIMAAKMLQSEKWRTDKKERDALQPKNFARSQLLINFSLTL